MRQLDWSPLAIRDLRSINGFLTKEAAPEIASAILRKIVEQTNVLPSYPHIGVAVQNGWRKLTVRGTRYLIIYRVTAVLIEILRIRHMAEDWGADP